jgi:hypothetical protein
VHREQGMAWAVFINLFFAGVLGLTFPPMVAAMGQLGAFCFYAGLNVIALVGIFCLVPETKRFTLEELDQVFAISRGDFLHYQTRVWLPYMLKRHVLRQKIAAPEPLLEPASDVDARLDKENAM